MCIVQLEVCPIAIVVLCVQKYRSRITRDGYLCVRSERTRSQQLNTADALDRIRSVAALTGPARRVSSAEHSQIGLCYPGGEGRGGFATDLFYGYETFSALGW